MLFTQPGTWKQRLPPCIGEKEIGQPRAEAARKSAAEVPKGSTPFPTPKCCIARLALANASPFSTPPTPYLPGHACAGLLAGARAEGSCAGAGSRGGPG